jgi:hypothetical protein
MSDENLRFRPNEVMVFFKNENTPTRTLTRWFTNDNENDREIVNQMMPFLRRMKSTECYKDWINQFL